MLARVLAMAVCLSVSVCLSVTSRSSIETAERIELVLAWELPSIRIGRKFVYLQKLECFALELCSKLQIYNILLRYIETCCRHSWRKMDAPSVINLAVVDQLS